MSPGSQVDAIDRPGGDLSGAENQRAASHAPDFFSKGWLSTNRVWCADITYIPVQRGFLYLVAIMDWATRHVLSWRHTMDAGFCAEALGDALARYGQPEIFNTDQGSQFTSLDFTGVLKNASIRISMDGRGRCMDNIFIERLWRHQNHGSAQRPQSHDQNADSYPAIVKPPETLITWPVTNAASSLAKNAMTPGISSGSPIRFIGIARCNAS